jgi:chromodomain protein Y
VEAILEKRTSRKGKEEFLIKWQGYDKDEDHTWEPTSNIEKHMIADFEKNEEKIKKKIIEAENSGQKRRSVRFSMENTEIEKDFKPNKDRRKSSGKQVSCPQH